MHSDRTNSPVRDQHARRTSRLALALAAIAVVASIGGSAYAAIVITGASVRDGSLQSRDIANGRLGVAGIDVKDGGLTGIDLRNGSVTGADVRNGTLGVTKLTDAARAALQGAQGPAGPAGAPGTNGTDGARGPQGPAANRLNLGPLPAALQGAQAVATTIDGFTISVDCRWVTGNNDEFFLRRVQASLLVDGPEGSVAQISYVRSSGDIDPQPVQTGMPVDAPATVARVESGLDGEMGGYGRAAGTVWLQSGEEVVVVDFHLFAENRTPERTAADACSALGAAVPTS